jgi:antitoxin HicB
LWRKCRGRKGGGRPCHKPAAFFRYAFPYRLEPDDAGGILLEFIDVPETHTFAPTAADAGDRLALDSLIAALGGYIKLDRAIPRPSPAEGRRVAILPPLVAAKFALYAAGERRPPPPRLVNQV